MDADVSSSIPDDPFGDGYADLDAVETLIKKDVKKVGDKV